MMISISIILVGCQNSGKINLVSHTIQNDKIILEFDVEIDTDIEVEIAYIDQHSTNHTSVVKQSFLFEAGDYGKQITIDGLSENTDYSIDFDVIKGRVISNFGVYKLNQFKTYHQVEEINPTLLDEFRTILNTFEATQNMHYESNLFMSYVSNITYTIEEQISMDYYNGTHTYSVYDIKHADDNRQTIYNYTEKIENGFDIYYSLNQSTWSHLFETKSNLGSIQEMIDLDFSNIIFVSKTGQNYDVILGSKGFKNFFDKFIESYEIDPIGLVGYENLLIHIEVSDNKISSMNFDITRLVEAPFNATFDENLESVTFDFNFSRHNLIEEIVIPSTVKNAKK